MMLIITGLVAVPTIIALIIVHIKNKKLKKKVAYTMEFMCNGHIENNILHMNSYKGDTIQIDLNNLLFINSFRKNNTGYLYNHDITQIVNYQTQITINNKIVYGAVAIQSNGNTLCRILNNLGYRLPELSRTTVYD